ncbi:unnamed protein product [Timema podura]|uniref:Major facilitator superfamily (MFS) profile domain-containing protein n=2 Tax=Timema TaxID=61471 RepID=A0ABN7NT09_TIMPD|nr:unnamed protein product [Timema podura]
MDLTSKEWRVRGFAHDITVQNHELQLAGVQGSTADDQSCFAVPVDKVLLQRPLILLWSFARQASFIVPGAIYSSSKNESASLIDVCILDQFKVSSHTYMSIEHGKFHNTLLFVCGLGQIAMVCQLYLSSYLLPAAQCDFQMTAQEKGLLNSISYAGVILSSPLWGFLADTQGRKKILILSLAADGIIGVLSSFAPTYGIFLAFRFFNGFFICSPAAVVYAYLGEFHNATTRPKAIILVSVFLPMGVVALPGLAWLVIPLTWNFVLLGITFNSWRLFVVLCALPSLITCLLIHNLLPESPKFLINQGKIDEALQVLKTMYVINTGNTASKYKFYRIVYYHSPLLAYFSPLDGTYMRYGAVPIDRGKSPLDRTGRSGGGNLFIFNSILLWLPEVFNNMASYSLSHDGQTTTICESMSGFVIVQTATNSTTNYNSSNSSTNISWWTGDDIFVTESYLNSSWPSGNNVTQLTPCITTVNPATFQNTLIIGGGMGVINLAIGYIVKWTGRKIISCPCDTNFPSVIFLFLCRDLPLAGSLGLSASTSRSTELSKIHPLLQGHSSIQSLGRV